MATKERLLAHLLSAPNQWFSGQSLAEQLGVSRESVWKAIRSLQQAGYQIDSD
ncbi:MAG: HTH domain-containing protein, partial [Limosilactobacillus fermentum]